MKENNPTASDIGAALVRKCVDSGIDWHTPAELVVMRQHLEALPVHERVRAVCDEDKIADVTIDDLWTMLDRRPSPEEYRELAAVLRDAALYCEKEAEVRR